MHGYYVQGVGIQHHRQTGIHKPSESRDCFHGGSQTGTCPDGRIFRHVFRKFGKAVRTVGTYNCRRVSNMYYRPFPFGNMYSDKAASGPERRPCGQYSGSGHAALVDPGAPQGETARPAPTRSIFGPQHPVPDPPNPQVGSLKTGVLACVKAVVAFTRKVIAAIQGLSRPKVRRMGDAPEPLFSRLLILRMLTVVGILIALTILVLAFRFVFRISADAEPEAPITFSLRPVAQPPQPYFE